MIGAHKNTGKKISKFQFVYFSITAWGAELSLKVDVPRLMDGFVTFFRFFSNSFVFAIVNRLYSVPCIRFQQNNCYFCRMCCWFTVYDADVMSKFTVGFLDWSLQGWFGRLWWTPPYKATSLAT